VLIAAVYRPNGTPPISSAPGLQHENERSTTLAPSTELKRIRPSRPLRSTSALGGNPSKRTCTLPQPALTGLEATCTTGMEPVTLGIVRLTSIGS